MIDLHAHTTISDGTVSPRELIRLAKEVNLSAIAITDHDSIDGHTEAQNEADKLKIKLIKGIEFSVSYGENRLIHILGLGIDSQNNEFLDIYHTYRKIRSEKLDHVFDELSKMGVSINRKDVNPYIVGGYMDRQAIAKCLVDKGYASIIKHSWINYLDHIPYIEGELITPENAFKAIHAGGGKSFMAHYHLNIGLKGYTVSESKYHLKRLKDLGLDGLESYYPSFSPEDIRLCESYIKEFGFLKSGGSDFHGSNRPHVKLGVGEGEFCVPDTLLENII